MVLPVPIGPRTTDNPRFKRIAIGAEHPTAAESFAAKGSIAARQLGVAGRHRHGGDNGCA